jgi:signal transduction histidine kinase
VEDFSLAEPEAGILVPEEGMRSGLSVLLQSGQRTLGALCLKSSLSHAYSSDDQKALESFAAHAAIAIENTRLYQQAQEIAVSEERQRLARELHDSVTQLLYSMSLLSSGWKKMAQDGRLADPAASFQQLEGIGLQALKEMRLLIHQLRPSVLEEAGLAGAVQHRLEAVEQRANIDTELVIDGDLPPLSPLFEEQLYNIAQEALNNALRHAQASAISVYIYCQDGQLSLMVRDNGVGFDTDNSSTGIGLQSMRERAEAIAAQLSVSSHPHEGTMVQVTVAV